MLRDATLRCPVCDEHALDSQGERLVCGGCKGALLTDTELRTLLNESRRFSITDEADGNFELAAPSKLTANEATRTCPRCTTQMSKHGLDGVDIDRCASHGLWFDEGELGRLLHLQGVRRAKANAREEARTNPIRRLIRIAFYFFIVVVITIIALTIAVGTHKRHHHDDYEER